MPITYRQLRDRLNELTEEQLDMLASVYVLDMETMCNVNDTILVNEFTSGYDTEQLEEWFDVHDVDDNLPLLIS